MSGWTRERDRIQQTLVGKTGVNVLVVEGEDDRQFFEVLLDKVAPGQWASRWAVGAANGKQNVLRILDDQGAWLGIVDRDEWSMNAATAAQNQRPGRLHILPRFCIESYFIDPDELWDALPVAQQVRVPAGKPTLEAEIAGGLAEWVRHGALWHVVNPLWDGLRAIGFKDALLDKETAQNDAAIKQKLAEWHAYLDPVTHFQAFATNLQIANAAPRVEQFQSWIHGKKFFKEHVTATLNGHLGQRSADGWMLLLRSTLPVPPDLAFLWAAMHLP